LISTVVMFQAHIRETINSTWKVAVSFKIIMTTSVTRPCFTTQRQTCKTKTKSYKTKTDYFWSQTDLVLRPTVSEHITGKNHINFLYLSLSSYFRRSTSVMLDPSRLLGWRKIILQEWNAFLTCNNSFKALHYS